jgi:hypothetical protein
MIKSLYRFLSPKFQNIFLDYPVDMQPRYGHGKKAHKGLYEIIDEHRADYKKIIALAVANKERFWDIKKAEQETDSSKPGWNNGFLPGLDIIAIYTLLSKYKPKKYIEVGSGNSTKVAYKAKQEQNLSTEIISIDPQPRAEIDNLADTVIRMPYENIDFDVVDRLEANDILFIDNSHRILPNSDAMVFFMETLPRLKKGVIVHIHDIYLPYDYPQFMCDRAYSEQYGLAFYLLANPDKYKTIFPNYFVSKDAELAKMLEPIWGHENLMGVERHGGSFWVQLG